MPIFTHLSPAGTHERPRRIANHNCPVVSSATTTDPGPDHCIHTDADAVPYGAADTNHRTFADLSRPYQGHSWGNVRSRPNDVVMFNDGSGVDDRKRVNAGAGIDHRTRHHDYSGFDDGAWRNNRSWVDCWRQHEAKREKFLRQPLAKPTISERHDCFVDADAADFRKTLIVSQDGNAQHLRMGRVADRLCRRW